MKKFPLLGLGIISLLGGVWAGFLRLSIPIPFPPWNPNLSLVHGPLMVSGFLGTVLGLERAVALRKPWAFLSPFLTGIGGIILLSGLNYPAGIISILIGSLFFVIINFFLIRIQPSFSAFVMGTGALSWAAGNILWFLGKSIPHILLFWAGFLIFIIAGERLELSQMQKLPKMAIFIFITASILFLGGASVSEYVYPLGNALAGIGMILFSIWLIQFDIARKTIRKPGLPRFAAVSLLSGYVWLGFSGLSFLAFSSHLSGFHYDIALHTLFLGFVFSMIFGHACIIFPAILGLPIQFQNQYYFYLILLALSLAVRMLGDLTGQVTIQQWGGIGNAAAILLFLAQMIFSILTGIKHGFQQS
ncbi:MAG: hypothetical protein M1169_01050 [Firmicutes bacterium]|nr:hypothetical protein [Bacillota bacterium]